MSGRKGLEMIAASPLFNGLPCHVVIAGSDTPDTRLQLQWAHDKLAGGGFAVNSSVRPGNAEAVIAQYVSANAIDVLVMGA